MADLYHFKITDDLDSDREPRTHLGRLRTDKGPKSEILGSHDCDLCESARRSSPGRRALYNGVQTAHRVGEKEDSQVQKASPKPE